MMVFAFGWKRFLKIFAIFVSTVSFFSVPTTGRSVNAFIKYHEVVNYKISFLGKTHPTAKPYLNNGFTFTFSAFQRNFSVIVWPNNHIFQTNVRITLISKHKETTRQLQKDLIFEGKLEGEQGSRVSGYILHEAFSGQISTKNGDTFYIEPLKERVNDLPKTKNLLKRGIIYKETDINHSSTNSRHKIQPLKAIPRLVKSHKRQERHGKQYTSCPVLLAADSSFYRKVGNDLEVDTLTKMSYHLSEADRLFRRTMFNVENNEDTIGLVIAAMKVFKDEKAEGIFSSPHDVAIKDYLRQWSKLDHSSYCLSLLFTFRDFPNGVLGLAWLAEVDTLGGICEPWNSNYNQSFNTAVVTFLNNGREIPEKVATLTVSHELGHGFGAKHDPAKCQPNDVEGNFIMYAHATDTGHPNNDRFSECSIHDMSQLLEAKAEYCFTDVISHCGNQIIESGEECDCGDVEECDKHDPCCIGRDDKNGVNGCVLKPSVQCSPMAGPCCTNNCKFINTSEKKICREETECSYKSFCKNGSCPQVQPKVNNKICNNGSNVCEDGQCKGSICMFYGRMECPCIHPRNSCHVCCNNSQGDCVSSAEFTGRIVAQPSKKSCHVNGYCDGAGRCIEHVDKPHQKYPDSFREVFNWISKKWYIFMFIGLSLFAQTSYGGFHKYRQYRARARRRETRPNGLEMTQMGNDNQLEVT